MHSGNLILAKLILAPVLLLTGQNLYTLKLTLTDLYLLPGPHETSLIPLLHDSPSESVFLGSGYPERMRYSERVISYTWTEYLYLLIKQLLEAEKLKDSFPPGGW